LSEFNEIKGTYFIEKYELCHKEFLNLIENIDIICDKAPDITTLKDTKSPTNLTNQLLKSPGRFPDYLKSPTLTATKMNISSPFNFEQANSNLLNINGNISTFNNNAQFQTSKFPKENVLMQYAPTNKNDPSQLAANQRRSIVNQPTNASSSGPQQSVVTSPKGIQIRTYPFDYSTLFYLKSSTNYIFDLTLTINTYRSLKMNKSIKKFAQFNLKNFVMYMLSYLYPIAKIKNFSFQFKCDISDDEANCVYDYYRVIFFNVIMFILNNTKDTSKERSIMVELKHDKFKENQGNLYLAIFKFTDKDPIVKYNTISNILQNMKNMDLKNIDLEKNRTIDFGLLVVFYIVSVVYASDFKISSNGDVHYIYVIFTSVGSRENPANSSRNNQNNSGVFNKERNIKAFKRPKTNIEEIYYNRIVDKMWVKHKIEANKLTGSSRKLNAGLKDGVTVSEFNVGCAQRRVMLLDDNQDECINVLNKI
jgi:hypothetical protein